MNIIITAPKFNSIGSANDGDPSNGPECSYSGAGPGRCTDTLSLSSSNPSTSTKISTVVQAVTGQAAQSSANSNAKGESNSTLTITYRWWEKILLFFGTKQKLSVSFSLTSFAYVADGPNQLTCVAHLTGGPAGTNNPIPQYMKTYNFNRVAGDPTMLDVIKENAKDIIIPNPGFYQDRDPGMTVNVEPGKYNLKFEVNGVATSDGVVLLSSLCDLILSEG